MAAASTSAGTEPCGATMPRATPELEIVPREGQQAEVREQTLAAGALADLGYRTISLSARYENLLLTSFLTVSTALSLLLAWRKPFFVDEYLSRYTALSGSPWVIWNVLKTAPLSVDPPLYHFLLAGCLRIFGPTEFFARLPSVLAYALMTFFLYRLVRRYADVFTGLMVVALCSLCGSFTYAYQARPYALVLAADAIALFAWTGFSWADLAEDYRKRVLALAGLFFGIAIAVGSHWFGFLVLIPLVLGEAFRSWQRRRIDAAVCAVIIAGGATALVYVPLLKAASEYKAMPWKGVHFADIAASFQLVLEPCLLPLVLILVIAIFAPLIFASLWFDETKGKPGRSIPTPVLVCLAAFALAPFPGFLVGKLVTHAFLPRYVLLCSVGLIVLASWAIRGAARRNPILMALAFLVIAGYASLFHYREFSSLPAGGDDVTFANAAVFSANPSLPVVPSNNETFLQLMAHGPAALRQRCILLTDPGFIHLLDENTTFLMAEGLRRWTKLPITDLAWFVNGHRRFYLIAGSQGALVRWLLQEHAELSLQGTFNGDPVYLVALQR